MPGLRKVIGGLLLGHQSQPVPFVEHRMRHSGLPRPLTPPGGAASACRRDSSIPYPPLYDKYEPMDNLPPRPSNDLPPGKKAEAIFMGSLNAAYDHLVEKQSRSGSTNQSKNEPGLRFDANKAPIHVLPPEWLKSLALEASKLGPDCRLDLIPPDVLAHLGLHYGVGARKYSDDNWKKGMSWTRCYDSGMRHMLEWRDGADFDKETSTPHTIAAAWNAFALAWYQLNGKGTDDRAG
jgi:hypothetical protein